MARKFSRRKGLKRPPKRKRSIKRGRGRRRLGLMEVDPGIIANFTPQKLQQLIQLGTIIYEAGKYFYPDIPAGPHLRGTLKGTKKKPRLGGMMPAGSAATVKYSGGLKIGKPRKSTFREKVMGVHFPAVNFNSKWTFQMDCRSAFVTAAQIPILIKPLLDPISAQLFTNMTTDRLNVPIPTLAFNDGIQNDQYGLMIHSYRSNIRFYNSSTNTLRGRIVWYKPRMDMDSTYENFGLHSNNPINQLMIASNGAQPANPVIAPAVGDGLLFDGSTVGANYSADYNHAGWPIVGTNTTATSTNNTVAYLDPSLVPGSPQVRRHFNQFWNTLKSEEFQLEPGNQFNTSLTIMGKMIYDIFDDTEITLKKECTIIGVVYVIGQIVFNDTVLDSTISTGSSQLSIMREDTCRAQPRVLKKTVRVNMTNPYISIADAFQGKINDETGELQDTYVQEG